MKKRDVVLGVIILVLVCILSSLSFAQEAVQVGVTPVKSVISHEQFALFEVTVFNSNTEKNEHVFLQLHDPRWSLLTEPLLDYTAGMVLGPQTAKKTMLMINPFITIPLGQHSLRLQAVDVYNKVKGEKIITITIVKEPVTDQAVDIEIDIPEKINPKRANSFKINLKNNNEITYSPAKIVLEGKFFRKESEIILEPLKSRTVVFTITVGDVVPQEDTIKVSVISNNEVISEAEKTIRYEESFGPIDSETITKNVLLKVIDEITLENKMSVSKDQVVKVKFEFLDDVLTKTSPKAAIVKENDNKYFTWNISLNPGEKTIITITRDYTSVFIIVLLVIILVIAYLVGRSPIIVIKSIKSLKTLEGGISEIKIILEVKNRSSHFFEDFELIDRIPSMAHFVKDEEAETLKPTKVSHYHKGVLLRWKMSLEPNEERIITYKIKSRLSILGSINLQPAIAKYKLNEKQEESYSNKIGVVAEVVVKEDE